MSLPFYKQQLDLNHAAHPALADYQHSKTQSLTLAVVTETWYPDINGVAHSLRKIISGLLDLGVKIHLFYIEHADAEVDERIQYFPQQGFHLPFYQEVQIGYPNTKTLQKQWIKHRPDIIQIVTEGPLGYSAMQAADRLNIPSISDYRTNFQQYSRSYHLGVFEGLVFAYLRHLHNKTRATLVPTQQLGNELEKLGFHNVNILSRGIDTESFSPKKRSESLRNSWQASKDELVFMYVGRIAPEKNLALAVEAFNTIRQYTQKTKLVLVGDGPIRKQLEQENPDFIFCGMKTGDELYEHYASGDVFLSPSITETFGNTVLEAMASGLAVLSYDYAAAREHIIHQENGVKAPLEDKQAFINQAIWLVQNPEKRKTIAHQAHTSIQQYSWKRISHNLLSILYQSIEEQDHD